MQCTFLPILDLHTLEKSSNFALEISNRGFRQGAARISLRYIYMQRVTLIIYYFIMKRHLFFLLLLAAVCSSCTHTGIWFEYRFYNQTDQDCIVSFTYNEAHQYSTCYNSDVRQSPITVPAGGEDIILSNEPHRPFQVYTSFTVTTLSGDTLYHSSPLEDKDWEEKHVIEKEDAYYTVDHICYFFTLTNK